MPTSPVDLWSKALQQLNHRGPDDSSYEILGDIFLGHARLRVIDQTSAASQPMVSSNGRWHLVFNGEIYNFREIARELGLGDHVTSDSRVLIESIAKVGVLETVKSVHGMFSLGVFDERNEEFWLLRDQFGEKPLYYFHDGLRFAFSSEIRPLSTLLSGLGVNPEPNLEIFASYLLHGFVPGHDTAVKNVHRLTPGGYLRAKQVNGIWVLTSGRWAAEWNVLRDARIPTDQELEQVLTQAISNQLIADVPVGCFLSGGVDSSLVTLLAAKQMKSSDMHTFSIGFETQSFDETHWAGIIASKLKTSHHKSIMSGDDAVEMYSIRKGKNFDLLSDPSILPTMFLSQQARQHVTVALSGDGADELFGGYRRYSWFDRLERASMIPGIRYLTNGASKLYGLQSLTPPQVGARVNRLFLSLDRSNKVGRYMPLLSPAFSNGVIEPCWFEDALQVVSQRETGKGSGIDWARSFDVREYLPGDILAKVDQASMAFSLEVRAPFLDKDVAYLASQFPSRALKSNGGKSVLKRLVGKQLGSEFANRPKMGFGPPLTEWLNGPLSKQVQESLSNFDWESVGLNASKIERIQRELGTGKATESTLIWSLSQFSDAFSQFGMTPE